MINRLQLVVYVQLRRHLDEAKNVDCAHHCIQNE